MCPPDQLWGLWEGSFTGGGKGEGNIWHCRGVCKLMWGMQILSWQWVATNVLPVESDMQEAMFREKSPACLEGLGRRGTGVRGNVGWGEGRWGGYLREGRATPDPDSPQVCSHLVCGCSGGGEGREPRPLWSGTHTLQGEEVFSVIRGGLAPSVFSEISVCGEPSICPLKRALTPQHWGPQTPTPPAFYKPSHQKTSLLRLPKTPQGSLPQT